MAIKNIPFHGEVDSAATTGGVPVGIYIDKTAGTPYTLDNLPADPKYWDYLVITDVILSAASSGDVALFADTDGTPSTVGAGEAIVNVQVQGQLPVVVHFQTPISVPAAATLVFKGPAGQCNCQVHGFIKANP